MRYSLTIFAIFSLSGLLPGQVTTGSIAGYALSSDGRGIPNVRVRIGDPATSGSRDTRTGADGYYTFSSLRPSVYDLSATAPQFSDTERRGIVVTVDSRTRVDFRLAVAGRKDSIVVTSTASPVQSETSDLSTAIQRTQIRDLPLNRRDFLQLALLSPGVVPPVQDSELSTRGSFAMHANGAREEFNNYLLDGVDNNDQVVNRYVLQPAVDAVQEFRILTNAYSAEYGRSAGAHVNVITRSGSNRYRGFVYEYLRNRVLDARNYFDGPDRAKYVRNQFGGGMGGPVVQDRVFFFADAEGLNERQGLPRRASVPPLVFRTGDFTAAGKTIVDPFSQSPFPGNRIPMVRIAPVSIKALDLFPAPNLPGLSGNYLSQPVLNDTRGQGNGRLDFRQSDRNYWMLRYSYGRSDLREPFAEASTDLPGFGDILYDRGHNATLQNVHTFGPRTVNSVSLGLNRATRRLLAENHGVDVNRLWGVSYLPVRPLDHGYPGVNVAGYSYAGDVTSLPIDRAMTTYQLSDTVATQRGAHSLKVGVELRKLQLNGILDLLARGTMSFSGRLTGDGLADLLLGLPSFALQSEADNTQTQRTASIGLFLQDDWKVTPGITLNAGLRYDYNTPVTDRWDRMSTLAGGSIRQVGTAGVSRSGYGPDRNNLAPRLGIAWSPRESIAIRAGYGIFYDAGMTVVNSSQYFNPPFFTIRAFFPTASSLLSISNPFPKNGGYVPPASLSTLSPGLRTPYVQQWNFNVQHDIQKAGVVTLAYAGSKGTHLIRSCDLNQPAPGPGAIASRAPYPQFSNIFFTESGSNSAFHSFQGSFRRPMARGLDVLATYTLGKSIDDTSAFLGTKPDQNFPQNSHNYGAERALSSYDVRHRALVALSWRVPGRSWWSRNVETSGIVSVQSGQPFTPRLRFDNSNTGNTGGNFGSDRPDVLGNPKVDRPTAERWFDTAAFRIPASYSFGSAGRNIVGGPGLATIDAGISRRFTLREQTALLVEAQAFNLLNRTNFHLPELYADDPGTFGRIFSAKPPRQIQFALRLEF